MSGETIKNFEPICVSLEEDPFAWFERVFVYFLQGFFNHPNFIGTGMHWRPSDQTASGEATEMIITAEKPSIDSIEKVPHVVCILGAGQFANTSLDQLQKLNMKTGERQHTDLVPQTLSIHCQAKSGALARRIAWYVAWGIVAMRRLIMRDGRIHHIAPNIGFSAESDASAYTGQLTSDEVVSVIVQVPFYWQTGWRIRPPAPVLENIEVTLDVAQAPVGARTLTLQNGRRVLSTPIDQLGERETAFEQKLKVSES